MKVKTLLGGFDGRRTYQPGDILDADSDHIRTLLFNGAAEPLDASAKEFAEERKKLSPAEVKKNIKFNQPSIADAVKVAVKEKTKVKKSAKKKRK